jgi:hypothetical protein
MPGEAGRARRESHQGGGTTVVKPEPSRRGAAALVVVVVAVAAAVVALVAARGAARRPVTEPTVTPVAPLPNSARVVEDSPAPAAPPPPRDPWPILDRLERAAAGERLYLKATTRGAIVELRSSFCAEARVRALLDAALADLRAQGVTRLACVEPHGATVFVRTL